MCKILNIKQFYLYANNTCHTKALNVDWKQILKSTFTLRKQVSKKQLFNFEIIIFCPHILIFKTALTVEGLQQKLFNFIN